MDWTGFSNASPQTVQGPGYAAELPPGFGASPPNPMNGGSFVWPPGSWGPPNSVALIWLLPIMPMQVAFLEQHYRQFDNPLVALQNAHSLGLASVLAVAPLRETTLNGASTLVREFDALSLNNQPVRMSAMLLRGPHSALQCIVGINMYRWVEFAGPALHFVGKLRLSGAVLASGEVRTIVDRQDLSRVEMQVVNADRSVAPIMSMPTSVGGTQVFHIHVESGGVIRFGDVQGTNVQIGNHNTTNALGPSAAAAAFKSPLFTKPTGKDDSFMSKFTTGPITVHGGFQQGDHNVQNNAGSGLKPADREELLALLKQLREQVDRAPLSEAAKKQLGEQVVPGMQQAADSPDPRPALAAGLKNFNANLKQADTAGKNLVEIAGTAAKIASLVGTGIHVVAPFLAGLL